jgi:hypothetical protein
MSIQKLISLDTPENWAFPSRALLEIDELQKECTYWDILIWV